VSAGARRPGEGRRGRDGGDDAPAAAWAAAALRAARRAYPPGNPAGVFAIDVGPRWRDGGGGEYAVRLYVERAGDGARAPAALGFLHAGRRHRVRPEVVATGGRARASSGDGPRCTGLHAGAALLVRDGGGARWGGVACVLRAAQGGTYLLTAGHLFGPGARGARVACALGPGRPLGAVGDLFANLLDLPPGPGDDDPLDAALVALTPAGLALLAATDEPRAPRPTNLIDAEAACEGLVQCFRPTANDFTPPVGCSLARSVAYLSADARPAPVAVSVALRTEGVVTAAGDSGALLCTAGDERLAAGACAGADAVGSLFVPLDRCLDRFEALFGLGLRLSP
jgi:hypothetical protein